MNKEWIILEFSRNELKVLWYLKRHGPLVATGEGPSSSIVTRMAEDVDLRAGLVRHLLQVLENEKCVVARTYKRTPTGFDVKSGYNPILRIELIDPDMYLPPLPLPALATVLKHETEEMYERTAVEPSPDAIILALLNRNDELQKQIDTLVERLKECHTEQDRLKKLLTEKKERKVPDHLSSRIEAALPPEVWDRLRHTGRP